MTCKPLIIGVAGGSGSGKTTIAKAILSQIGSIEALILQHDSYYRDLSHLSVEKRAAVNFDHPDSLETDLMVHQINELIAGREVEVPRYDFTTHSRVSPGTIKRPAEVILVEGILILAEPSLRELMDLKIFVDTDSDLRFIRRLERDIKERGRSMESVVNQYLHSVRPMHLAFVESSRRYADILIPEGYNPVSTGMVVKTIKHWIKEIRSSHQEKEASPMAEKLFVGSQQLLEDSVRLGLQIIKSGFRPDFIVGIWRGGTPVGIAVQELMEFYKFKTDHIAIRTSAYEGIEKMGRAVRVHGLNYIVRKANADDSLLIVDDIYDTGLSINAVLETMKEKMRRNLPSEIKIATVYYKPANNKTNRTPDFFVHETDRWVVFPHELKDLSDEEMKKGKPELYRIIQEAKIP